MKDIQLDSDGNFRCWNCGGKNFSEKRTRRSKVIGVGAGVALTPLAAAGILAAKKRLYCQGCGEYNKMGDAQPYTPAPDSPTATSNQSPSAALEAVGVAIIALVVFVLTFLTIAYQAWWWLVVLAPACMLVLVGLAGFAVELLAPAGKSLRRTSKRPGRNSVPVRTDAAGPAFTAKKPRRSF
ncbi:hypothetical protein [Gordonia sp. ABSL49_1]|uniref:hypothetical protein n=1 Tax=Gordonia sp. ABSL49_1 TaxID=2920941 RepID=UPI001F0D96E6|nr:hypothetical protein [Gordonia sp. ABSL49_1]MCH5645167.1 hypothetical protein [Gordonia sp. ABSL49_1]